MYSGKIYYPKIDAQIWWNYAKRRLLSRYSRVNTLICVRSVTLTFVLENYWMRKDESLSWVVDVIADLSLTYTLLLHFLFHSEIFASLSMKWISVQPVFSDRAVLVIYLTLSAPLHTKDCLYGKKTCLQFTAFSMFVVIRTLEKLLRKSYLNQQKQRQFSNFSFSFLLSEKGIVAPSIH